jgi:hypothetical protein
MMTGERLSDRQRESGCGTKLPNVEGAEKPTSSVMINRMFGAPLGGTTVAGHAGFDWVALRLISPRNFCGGGGMYRPFAADCLPYSRLPKLNG